MQLGGRRQASRGRQPSRVSRVDGSRYDGARAMSTS
jgi:hypothetical protein